MSFSKLRSEFVLLRVYLCAIFIYGCRVLCFLPCHTPSYGRCLFLSHGSPSVHPVRPARPSLRRGHCRHRCRVHHQVQVAPPVTSFPARCGCVFRVKVGRADGVSISSLFAAHLPIPSEWFSHFTSLRCGCFFGSSGFLGLAFSSCSPFERFGIAIVRGFLHTHSSTDLVVRLQFAVASIPLAASLTVCRHNHHPFQHCPFVSSSPSLLIRVPRIASPLRGVFGSFYIAVYHPLRLPIVRLASSQPHLRPSFPASQPPRPASQQNIASSSVIYSVLNLTLMHHVNPSISISYF